MGWTSLHDAVIDASISHATNTMSIGDIANAAHLEEATMGDINGAPATEASAGEGYDELREEIQANIAALVDTMETVNQAEATGDLDLLRSASATLSETLTNSTAYWEVQVRVE
jgi:hypothetical protein|tara:strand:- start:6939 stop:7280 length:342 start_codon:yes stop_codon:yes gene_type:complete